MTISNVHQGIWRDHSFDDYWGYTLTLDNSRSFYLISFLSIYISIVGGCLWSIVAFVLYHFIARPGPGHTIRHQNLLTLRSSSSPWTSALEFALVTWTWRKTCKRRSIIFCSFLLILPPTIIYLGSLAYGILWTKAVGADSQVTPVRFSSENCGLVAFNGSLDQTNSNKGPLNFTVATEEAEFILRYAQAAQQYSNACYAGSTKGNMACQGFTTTSIQYTSSLGKSCPFSETMCLFPIENSAYELDTGLIDSNFDLGINAVSANRIQYRKVTTCSVLNSMKHSKTFYNSTKHENITLLYFGSSFPAEFTYEYIKAKGFVGYQLDVLGFNPYDPHKSHNNWIPIRSLRRQNADTSIYILTQNQIIYSQEVLDPWFKTRHSPNELGFYPTLNGFRVLGCADQYQICKGEGVCTNLTAIFALADEYPRLGLSAAQFATAQLLLNASLPASMPFLVSNLGAATLLAQRKIFETVASNGLPSNMWRHEVSNMFNISLAALQALIVQFSSKSFPPSYGKYLITDKNATEYICQQQKGSSIGEFQSFRFAALVVIVVTGSAIVIVSMAIDLVYKLCARFNGSIYKRRVRWVTDNKFQLQRIAYSSSGVGDWERGLQTIPRTVNSPTLPVPQVFDKSKMPMYTKPKIGNAVDTQPSGTQGSGTQASTTKPPTVQVSNNRTPTAQAPTAPAQNIRAPNAQPANTQALNTHAVVNQPAII